MAKWKLLTSVLLVFGLILTACGGQSAPTQTSNQPAPANNNPSNNNQSEKKEPEKIEPIVIKMADHLPANHAYISVAEFFQQRAVELSGGKIKFDYYPGGQLGSINEMGGLVRDGAVDLGYVAVATASFLPLSSVISLPSYIDGATTGGKIFTQLLEGVLAEEWKNGNMVPIYSWLNPPNSILTTKKKVVSGADLNGLKIRGSGGLVNHIPGYFGATSVSIGVAEIYEAMQKGVVDGALFTISSAPDYHYEEVTKYVLTGANFGVIPQVYAINLDTWNKLPEDVQQALLQAGKEATALVVEMADKKVVEALKFFGDSGVEITTATPEQKEGFLKTMAPLDEVWLEDLKGKGVDGTAVLKEFRSLTEGL